MNNEELAAWYLVLSAINNRNKEDDEKLRIVISQIVFRFLLSNS